MTPSVTPSVPPTSTPGAITYINSESDVAAALGCTNDMVSQVRQLNLEPFTSYLIMRIWVFCGCKLTDIMTLRLNMGWDDICNHYGIVWDTFMDDLDIRISVLSPEFTTVNQIIRADANNPDDIPIEPLPIPTPVGLPLIFAQPIAGACP